MGQIRDSSTCCQVRVGSCGHVPSYQVPRLPLPKAQGLVTLIRWWKPRARLIGGLGLAPGRGGRQDGQTGGEILSTSAYHRAEK
jgi:hypothetical protein